MSYRLTDEALASCHGNLARGEAVRTMVERHEKFHSGEFVSWLDDLAQRRLDDRDRKAALSGLPMTRRYCVLEG